MVVILCDQTGLGLIHHCISISLKSRSYFDLNCWLAKVVHDFWTTRYSTSRLGMSVKCTKRIQISIASHRIASFVQIWIIIFRFLPFLIEWTTFIYLLMFLLVFGFLITSIPLYSWCDLIDRLNISGFPWIILGLNAN